jgi:hypothetical protein
VYGCQTLSDFRAEAALHRISASMVPMPPPQEAPPPDQPEETAPNEVVICSEPTVPPEAAQDESSSSDSGQFRVFLIDVYTHICNKLFLLLAWLFHFIYFGPMSCINTFCQITCSQICCVYLFVFPRCKSTSTPWSPLRGLTALLVLALASQLCCSTILYFQDYCI